MPQSRARVENIHRAGANPPQVSMEMPIASGPRLLPATAAVIVVPRIFSQVGPAKIAGPGG